MRPPWDGAGIVAERRRGYGEPPKVAPFIAPEEAQAPAAFDVSGFASEAVLDARFGEHEDDRRVVARLVHHELKLLASIEARLDLAIGRGLRRLARELSIADLGHSRFDDLCKERYGFSARHARDLALIAERLDGLPVLSGAFLAGSLNRTVLRELVKVATPANERGWAQLGKKLPARRLQAIVSAARRGAADAAAGGAQRVRATAEDIPEPVVRASWTARAEDAAAWSGWGRAMVRAILGRDATDADLAEAVAADTLATLGHGDHGVDPEDSAPEVVRRRRGSRAERDAQAPSASDLARLGRRFRALAPVLPARRLPDPSTGRSAFEVHEAVAALVCMRNRLESERGILLTMLRGRSLHRELGFRCLDAYLSRSLGLVPREATMASDLGRKLDELPSLALAHREGSLAPRTVFLLTRIARRETDAAWVDYASRCTFKRLELDVEGQLAARMMLSERRFERVGGGRPREGTSMNRLRLDWQRFFGLRERDERIEEERESAGSQRACHSAGESNAVAEPLEADIDADFDADEVPPAPRRSHRCGFMAPLHVAELWDDALRRVREVVDPSFDDGQCVTWMLLAFARAHASPEIREAAREHSCCERDGWACTMPGCRSRRLLHAHHVVFRSRQGKGDLSNLTTLCEGCHLRLVHEGKVVISGGAPDALTILTCIDALGRARETWRDETRVSGRSR